MNGCIDVPHIEQSEDWDCGLACSRMLLKYCGIPIGADGEELAVACKKIGVVESVWTIDIAHLMSYFGLKHKFFTVTLGVDPTYNAVGFYNSDHFVFSEEEVRINALFQSAADKGISLTKRSIHRDEIISQLKDGHPAIVLIDAMILHCDTCHNRMPNCFSTCMCLQQSCNPCKEEEGSEQGYVGHFIVVCGYDLKKEQFFYKNPAIETDLCSCSFNNLDLARKSHGTDEDILFIQR